MAKKLFEDDDTIGHFYVDGIPVRIEYKRGDTQSGKSDTGEEWSRTFHVHYGFIPGIEGADNDSLDVFVKPKFNTGKPIFVIHSLTPDGKKFDEDKVMLGFDNAAQAHKVWAMHIHEPENMFGGIDEFTLDEFNKVLDAVNKGNKGIIAKTPTFFALKGRDLLPSAITSLAFNEYLVDDNEKAQYYSFTSLLDPQSTQSSHIIPSDRHTDHQMGRFRQYVDNPLSNGADKWYYVDNNTPSAKTAEPTDFEPLECPKQDYNYEFNPGQFGQNQGRPLDYGNHEHGTPVAYTRDSFVDEIPHDQRKANELKYKQTYDEEPKDSEWEVNNLDVEMLNQQQQLINWIVDELRQQLSSKASIGQVFDKAINILSKRHESIYLKFGRTFTEKELRKAAVDSVKRFFEVVNETV